jgi:hypothetical protein
MLPCSFQGAMELSGKHLAFNVQNLGQSDNSVTSSSRNLFTVTTNEITAVRRIRPARLKAFERPPRALQKTTKHNVCSRGRRNGVEADAVND